MPLLLRICDFWEFAMSKWGSTASSKTACLRRRLHSCLHWRPLTTWYKKKFSKVLYTVTFIRHMYQGTDFKKKSSGSDPCNCHAVRLQCCGPIPRNRKKKVFAIWKTKVDSPSYVIGCRVLVVHLYCKFTIYWLFQNFTYTHTHTHTHTHRRRGGCHGCACSVRAFWGAEWEALLGRWYRVVGVSPPRRRDCRYV